MRDTRTESGPAVVCASAAAADRLKQTVKMTRVLFIGTPPVSDVRPEQIGLPVKRMQSFRE